MLRGILKIIQRDGYISRTKLARELDVSSELVDQAIGELLRMGYLVEDKTGADCPTVCSKCPYAKNCGKDIVKFFSISAKGQRYLEGS